MQSIYIGRQPIIDSDSNLCAYEVLYKGSEAAISRYSSASIINSVLNKFGTHSLLGNHRGFVKIDEKFLLHDIIFSIPSEFFVFSVLESVELNERVVERIENLHKKGYKLCIDSLKIFPWSMEKYDTIFPFLDFVKVNIKESSPSQLKENILKIKDFNIVIVADTVEDMLQFDEAKRVGCDQYQGYFFAEPVILENAVYEPSHMAILKLYNLLMQDVNIDEIAQAFEDNHEITIQLLQFINSGAFHFKNRISSIHHVLTLVGRIPLGQWLMLMIYSKSVSKEGHTPIMLMVKNRTELMQSILKVINPSVKSNMLGEAYFVGVLSLIDTVFSVKLEEILVHVNISQEVESALLRDEGLFGEIFALVRDIEDFKIHSVALFEKKHKLKSGSIEEIVVESMKNVNVFESPEVL
jgi:EAL and modified HD-GYP domain-containing signal transduction protein